MIWALLEDLLLVQLGLVVGRVALVEVGHFVFYVSRRRVDGVPAASRGAPEARRALRAATASLLARDGAHACSHRSRALVLVRDDWLSCVCDQYSQQSAALRFWLLASVFIGR